MKLKVVLWLTVGDRMCMDSADVCVDKICFYIRLIAVFTRLFVHRKSFIILGVCGTVPQIITVKIEVFDL